MMNTYSLWWGYKLPSIQKIALSGLFIALACILNKVLAINYISAVPFVRISFGGPAIIMFASFLLGPIYGALIGGLSDILGYFVFDIKAYPWYPSITSTYILLGLMSGFLFYLVKKIKNKKISMICTYLTMFLTFIGLTIYLVSNDTASWWGRTYQIQLWMKIVFPSAMFILFVGLILFDYFFDKKNKNSNAPMNVYQLTLSCFVIEILIMTIYGSLMKSVAFGMDIFIVILFCQAMTMFFNIPFNVVVLSFIMKVNRKYYLKEED